MKALAAFQACKVMAKSQTLRLQSRVSFHIALQVL